MAYASTNPPVVHSQPFGNSLPKFWTYKSSDPITTVVGAGYFSDGRTLGMKKWDQVWVIDSNTTAAGFCWVSAVSTGSTTPTATVTSTLTST